LQKFFHLQFSQAITSSTAQKGPDCTHRFIIAVAVDVVTCAADVRHLTTLPELYCFLGHCGRDNRMELRITRQEQDGALNT
jgi:hypothetical protein